MDTPPVSNSINHLFDNVPDDVFEDIISFCQPCVKYHNTFGITRAIAPVRVMHVCRRWRDVITVRPRLWTDISVRAKADVGILKLHLQRAGQGQRLRLWVIRGALTETAALHLILPYADRLEGIFLQPLLESTVDRSIGDSPTFGLQVTMGDLQNWIGMPLPNLQYLVLEGLAINGHPPTIQLSLPSLKNVSFGMTVPRFRFPDSQLRYLGFFGSLVTMRKLSDYMAHCRNTLEVLCLDGVTMTDVDAPGEGFPNLEMSCVTEITMQVPGGDGLAEHLLTSVHYPQLRTLTFGASPGKLFGSWQRIPSGRIQLTNLEILDFDSGVMPIGAFQDILKGAAGIRKLVLPRFSSQEHVQAAVETLIAWSNREGKEASHLEEMGATGLKTKQMIRIVEALPSVQTLDVSRSSEKRGQAEDSDDWRWLQEHVENLFGLEK